MVFFSRGRKEKRGGGVGILVNRNINIEPKLCDANEVGMEYIEKKFENLVVKLPGCLEIGPSSSNNKRDLILVVIYRQPNSGNLDNFLDSVDQLLQKIDKPSNEIIIAGDMNLDLLKYETHPQTAQYLDIMSSHRLLPQIVRPTRIKHQSATLIDHIFTRGNDISLMSGILDLELAGNSGYTDHKPTFIFLKAKIPPKKYSQLANFSFFTVEVESVKRRRARGLPRLMPLGSNIFPSGGILSYIFGQKVKFYILDLFQTLFLLRLKC